MYKSYLEPTAGFVKVTRELLQTESWNNSERVKLYILILSHAKYKDHNVIRFGYNIQLIPGQLLTTVSDLAVEMKVSAKTIRGHLQALERDGLIKRESLHNRFTIITIVASENGKSKGKPRGTPMEQPMGTLNTLYSVNYECNGNADHLSERQTKEVCSEQTLIEDKNNRILSLLSRVNERESELFKKLLCDTEVDCKLRIIDKDPENYLESFIESCIELQKVTHRDYADLRSHFYSWIAYQRKNCEKNPTSASNSNNLGLTTNKTSKFNKPCTLFKK